MIVSDLNSDYEKYGIIAELDFIDLFKYEISETCYILI
jgi:hypothetical protein